MKNKINKNKIKVNDWVTIKTELQNGMIIERFEVAKVLAIENRSGELLQSLGEDEYRIGYLVKTAQGLTKWIRSRKIKKIFPPTALGLGEKGIIKLERILNNERKE